jgi:hypothetical protein
MRCEKNSLGDFIRAKRPGENRQLRKYLYGILLNSDRSELRVKLQNQWQYEVEVGRYK